MTLTKLFSTGVLALLGLSSFAWGEEAKPVQAIWKPQEFTFYYQSFTTFYSCESLESKLEQILSQLGAQAKIRVRDVDCGRGVVRAPRAEIQLISPVEATPEAIAEVKKTDSRRELAARVSGDRAQAVELTEQFPAQWKQIKIIEGRAFSSLQSGDCELLDQVRRKLLPKLAVRVVDYSTPCPPNTGTLARPSITVEALVELPKPDDVDAKREKKAN